MVIVVNLVVTVRIGLLQLQIVTQATVTKAVFALLVHIHTLIIAPIQPITQAAAAAVTKAVYARLVHIHTIIAPIQPTAQAAATVAAPKR
jgi:hypothetical protein